MLAYVTIGTNQKEKALAFYDEIAGMLGAQRAFNNDRIQFYKGAEGAMFGIGTPADLGQASVGNGVMPAFSAPDNETVDRVYARALELGATDSGAPAQLMPIFYGGYFRDLDGNRVCVCKFG